MKRAPRFGLLRHCQLLLMLVCPLQAEEPSPKTPIYSKITDFNIVRRFEREPRGWKAGFRSIEDWRGTRGFTESSRESSETGIGWFSNGSKNLYRNIRAPRGAAHAIAEGRFSADHTQLTAVDAHPQVKAGEMLKEVSGSFDMTVCFADDGKPATRDVFNCFFQIFERGRDYGWRPAYGLFFQQDGLRVGAWDDNPFVPDLRIERGKWHRIRFDVSIRNDGATTLLSVWPVSSNGIEGKALVSGLMIEHACGFKHPGVARSFPVMVGSYTWGIPRKDPVSAATLISAFRQDAKAP